MSNGGHVKLYRVYAATFLLSLLCGAYGVAAAGDPSDIEQLRRAFLRPPDDARIMMRWWWFGSGVTKPEIERELRVMKAAGIGGVEVQPVYPLELDDPQKNFHNLPYLSDGFIDALRFTAQTARELGLRIDITLGSGWPYGGPHTPITEAAGRLRCDRVAALAGTRSVSIPAMENGEKLLATFLVNGTGSRFSSEAMRQLTETSNGRAQLPEGAGARTVLFFISSRTGQQVKRAGVGAEGYVLDHYDRAAIEHHLSTVGERLLQAFGADPPHSVFSDSLEVFGSDWTPDFLSEFRKRRGYDLTPYLPALVGDIGNETDAIRHDWGKTLTELAEEHYLTPVREWAHQHHTLFRSQTYGIPPVVLSSNALVDLPEGEGPHWRGFGPGRWAASASHLYGRPVTSSETFTWLHSPVFRATPLDMKADADIHFLQGINQLVGHGWPYSPESAQEPGWHFYASGALNDHNPWFQVMPDITQYLQRMSFLLRQGKPANDLAVYLPTDDAWAGFTLGKDSVDRSMEELLGPNLVPQILNSGYNFDFIDDGAITSVGIPYPVVILPGVERIPLQTLQKLQSYVQRGGLLIATRRLPSLAPGLREARSDTPRIKELCHQLFETSQQHVRLVEDEQSLGSTLTELLPPDFATGAASEAIGFVHRKLSGADLYFVVNTSNQPVDTRATVRASRAEAEWWDPISGEMTRAEADADGNKSVVPLKLEPYESRVLAIAKFRTVTRPARAPTEDAASLDISPDWTVTFPKLDRSIQMHALRPWTDDEETRYYSGLAVYEKTVRVPEVFLKPGLECLLDFGPGTPTGAQATSSSTSLADSSKAAELGTKSGPGTRTWLDSPIRESAIVYVNGEKAGSVWHPPYQVDVTRFLKAGDNQLRVVVGNLAINELAGQAPADYRLLNLLYGVRFTAQDMNNLSPLPSGILGKVQLVAR